MEKDTSNSGRIFFFLLFLYTCSFREQFPKLPTIPLIILEVIVLLFCEFGPISHFLARKICHAFSGVMMLHLDMDDWMARYFVYSVVVSTLVMVWQLGVNFNFRFSSTRDVGVSVYLCIVTCFFYTQTPLEIINPVFLSDPLGAIVGKSLNQLNMYNPRWFKEKTVGGSIAVFCATLLTLSYGSWHYRLLLSLIVTIVEGITLQFDNLFITITVVVGYLATL